MERMQFSGGLAESGYRTVVHVGVSGVGGGTHFPCTDTVFGGPFVRHCVLNACVPPFDEFSTFCGLFEAQVQMPST